MPTDTASAHCGDGPRSARSPLACWTATAEPDSGFYDAPGHGTRIHVGRWTTITLRLETTGQPRPAG